MVTDVIRLLDILNFWNTLTAEKEKNEHGTLLRWQSLHENYNLYKIIAIS